jgi:phosphate-selective porin OprO and OprP
MIGRYRVWRAAAIAAAATLAPFAAARADATIEELQQRLDEQEQKIRVLERRLELQDESAAAAKETTPVVSAGAKGFSLRSADSKNQVKIRGVLHVDGRYTNDDETTGVVDTFQATRVRPIIEGTFGGLYDFRFTPDFGQGRTVIQDAYVTARLHPAFALTAGKFKTPVGLERLQSANDIRFVSRAFPTALAPNRDLGLKVEGEVLDGRLSYAAAVMNGAIDGGSSETLGDADINDDKEYALRLFSHPFAQSDSFLLRGLGVGIAGSWTDQTGTALQPLLPSFRTPEGATFFRYRTDTTPTLADGERTRIAPQFYYYAGRLGILGEYTEVSQDVSRDTGAGVRTGTVDTAGWQVAASWFLTGEEASFRGFQPKSTFSPGESWGAFELVARVHQLDIDEAAFAGGLDSFADPETSAERATGWSFGLNWYLNENLKWMLDYEHTSYDGGATGGGDRDDTDALLLRIGLGF